MIRRPPRSKRIDTLVPYPTLFRFLAHLGRIAARRVDLQADVEIPAVGADGKSEAAVIIGFGRVGRLVAEMLSTHGRAYIAVDRSEEHTSELQSLMRTSSAVFCLKKNN